jgi:hypothetical protein
MKSNILSIYQLNEKIANNDRLRNPPPTFGGRGFRVFGTHFVNSWAGYPLRNAMTASYFPKIAETH